MLPNTHTDNFSKRDNKTGMVGEITNRQITYVDSYGGDYRIIEGVLNGVPVVETHSISVFGGGSEIETKTQYDKRVKEFDEVCASLV